MAENGDDIGDDLFLEPTSEQPSMVTIGDLKSSHLSVFPPINHEGLLDNTSFYPQSQHESPKSPWFSPSQSTSSFSSSSWAYPFSAESDESDGYLDAFPQLDPTNTKHSPPAPTPPHASEAEHTRSDSIQAQSQSNLSSVSWLGFALKVLRHKVVSSASSIPGKNVVVGAFRIFPLMTTVATVYVASLVFTWVRRGIRRGRDRRIEKLMGAIREKDDRIVKLLNQIARLNEVLVGHHHQSAQ